MTLPQAQADIHLYIAGAKADNGKLLTAGGRVLGLTAVDQTLELAIQKAYQAMAGVHFEGMFYRKDIGQRALAADRSRA